MQASPNVFDQSSDPIEPRHSSDLITPSRSSDLVEPSHPTVQSPARIHGASDSVSSERISPNADDPSPSHSDGLGNVTIVDPLQNEPHARGPATSRQEAPPTVDQAMREGSEEKFQSSFNPDIPSGMIEIRTGEGRVRRTTRNAASLSHRIEGMGSHNVITLSHSKMPHVRTLDVVIEYLEHHNGVGSMPIPRPLRSNLMSDVVSDQWDATYIDAIGDDRTLLYDVIAISHTLGVRDLVVLGCAKLATFIRGQPLEKVHEILSQGLATGLPAARSLVASLPASQTKRLAEAAIGPVDEIKTVNQQVTTDG